MQINLTDEQLQNIQDKAIRDLQEKISDDLYYEVKDQILNNLLDNKFCSDMLERVKENVKAKCIAEIEEGLAEIVKKELGRKKELIRITKTAIKDASDDYFHDELKRILSSYRIDVKINKKEKK